VNTMTTEEINLTPFEAADLRAAEFGENVTQASVWAMAAQKLNALDEDTPEGMAEKLVVGQMLTAIVSVPGCVTAEA